MRIQKGDGTKRAAIYLRMSSDGQKESIPQQRDECRQYAADHGYTIVGEYIDAGISGIDSRSKRSGFRQMVTDAESGKFDFVLCYELSRASRSKPREFIAEMGPIADAGVKLVFTDCGVVDLDDFTSFLQASIASHSANDYVMRLARGTVRGQRNKAKRGLWVSGNPPLGLIADQDGIIGLGKPEDIATIRLIFRLYVEGKSYRGIVEELQSRGIKKGVTFIAAALKNRLYVGDFVWNRKTQARFFSIRNDKIATDFETGETDEADQIIIENNHPAIIDRETFDRVQAMFDSRKRQSAPILNGGKFVLTGLCRCKACGSNMIGFTSNGNAWLRCGGHMQHGLAKCHNNLVEQRKLVDAIVDSLEREFLDASRIAAVRKAYLTRIAAEQDTIDVDAVRRQREAAEKRYKTVRRNLGQVKPEFMEDLEDELRDIKNEIAEYDRRIETAEVNVHSIAAGFDDDVEQFAEMIRDLKSTVHDADPHVSRAFLSSIIEKVVVDVSRREAGSRLKYTLEGGEILLNPGVDLCAAW